MIELQHIQKSFLSKTSQPHIALNDVNLFIQEGEIFGIIGKSGAGKSTLLRMINLLERPDAGHVIVDNEEITPYSEKKLRCVRHKIGMIFQHFNLISNQTVFENIAFPMKIQGMNRIEINNKINELLPIVDLESKRDAYPHQLSGGQKQRIAIARALSSAPKILLCDEATSALDPETTASILQLLQKINQEYGLTIVLITHEMDVIKQICHRLTIIEQGRLVETTSLTGLFTQPVSLARQLVYAQLTPKMPPCLASQLSPLPSRRPIVRIHFESTQATEPFISRTSQDLHIDINILLANIDRLDSITCGVLVAELSADKPLLNAFIHRCKNAHLEVEILGYVPHPI
jgi:D-methionine transport system ATP-binding protein